jgi:pimeloyl-ACP methyl ester carboxylesterase
MKSLAYALILLPCVGCDSHSGSGRPTLLAPCTDPSGASYTAPASEPGFNADLRGQVFRCESLDSFEPAEVNELLTHYDFSAAPVTKPFYSYRIAYRTERAAPAGAAPVEGDTAALLLLPPQPNDLPLVVFAHGSVGIDPSCGPSRHDLRSIPDNPYDHDYPVSLFTLAGYGFTVIAPDYPGFAYDQPPGYFSAPDEAHALLDATRAAAQLLPPERRPQKVVLVGHSQGGHAVLAAQALARSYGTSGELAGVAAFAPYWLSMASYAAVSSFLGTTQFNTTDNSRAILYSSEYFYSSSWLLDGFDHRLDVFAESKRADVEHVLRGGSCYDTAGLAQLGRYAYDFFDGTFTSQVGSDCAIDGHCTTPLSMTWLSRFQTDRPLLDPSGAKVLIYNGGTDIFVPRGYAQCGRDRIAENGALAAVVENCYDAALGHNDMIRRSSADWVNQWIAHVAGAGAAPAACTPFPSDVTCTTPPKNL